MLQCKPYFCFFWLPRGQKYGLNAHPSLLKAATKEAID